MYKLKFYLVSLLLVLFSVVQAQQSFTVADSVPVTVDGLSFGFHIKSSREKEVGNKGEFSRYSVQFYVTNISPEAKISLYKQGWQLLNDISPAIVQFDCLNATGARFTSKGTTLSEQPCTVLAQVDDKECNSDKVTKNKRFVQIGYWIKPGETISSSSILIVPLNELPNVRATLFPNNNALLGNASYAPALNNDGFNPAGQLIPGGFVKLKNVWKGSYIHNQQGPLSCSTISPDWWSAQWKLVPVLNNSFYIIKNKWKETFISTADRKSLQSPDFSSAAAMWTLEPVAGTNAFRLQNAADHTYLNIESGILQSTPIQNDAWSARWILEP